MASKKWTVIDAQNNASLDELTIGPRDIGTTTKFSVVKRTLKGGLRDGVDSIRVDNGRFVFDVLPTRGMSVWKAWIGDEEIGWTSPVRGPVHPKYVAVAEPSGLGWLDGFDELFVRCGLESNGAPDFDETGRLKFPLHGRIANRPANFVEVGVDSDAGEITVKGVVEETRFHFLKLRMTTTLVTRFGELGFRVRDEIENLSASPAEIQILYHVNFGVPLLDAGARIAAPLKTVVPRNEHAASGIKNWDSYAAETPGFEEQVYLLELVGDSMGRCQALLKNAHATRGASLTFNVKQLPCFTVWKNTTAVSDGYVTGLEPGTNYPNPRTHEGEQGRVVKLPPHGGTAFDIGLEVHVSAKDVERAEKQIAQLQAGTTPKIFDKPQTGWCAGVE